MNAYRMAVALPSTAFVSLQVVDDLSLVRGRFVHAGNIFRAA
jgi:hypothetical protein